MNESIRKRIAALEERTKDAGKLELIKACFCGMFGPYGCGEPPEDFVAQIDDETIKAAGGIGKQFIALFDLELNEDHYWRPKKG